MNIVKEFIGEWIKSLVVLLIIISIVDMVMPKGKMKRYVDFIVGLIIIFAIINPFINLLNLGLSYESEEAKEVFSFVDEEGLLEEQEEQIKSIYLESLKGEIGSLIEENTDYSVDSVDITTKEDGENSFLLDEIFIGLEKGDSDLQSNINIDKIKIGHSKDGGKYLNTDPEVEELIANHLEFDPEKINISIDDREDKNGKNTE